MDDEASRDGTDSPAPRRSRSGLARAAPAVVVIAAVAASFASIAIATRLPTQPTFPTNHFLPEDGDVSVERVRNSAGDAVNVSEHARLRGIDGVLALPGTFGLGAIDAAESFGMPLEEMAMWRVTSRLTQDGETQAPSTAVYAESDAGLHLVELWGPSISLQYSPPLLLLPADPSPGDRWTSAGDALPASILTYVYEGEVTDVTDGGCVRLSVRYALDQTDVGPFLGVVSDEEWCPGLGPTRTIATYTYSDGSTEVVEFELDPDAAVPDPVGDPTAATSVSWSGAERWEVTEPATVLADPFFGDQPVGGTAAAPVVVLPDGTILVAYGNGDDVVAMAASEREGGEPVLAEVWRAHPGGAVLTIGTVGDVTVVTTTQRNVVAYGADGARLWSSSTDDLVLGGAAGTPDGLAVTVGLDGQVVARDALTGATAWSADLVTDADLPAVAAGDTVVATDRNGTVAAFEATTGRRLWETSGEQVWALGAGPADTVVTADVDGHVVARTLREGDEVWEGDVDGYPEAVVSAGELTVVVSDGSTAAFGPDGERRWTSAAAESVAASGDVIVLIRGDVATALDTDGTEIASWPVQGRLPGTTKTIAASGEGAWVLDSAAVLHLLDPPRLP